MAGHSKFKNIMHRKKAVDARRSRAFNKHARLIMSAARTGGTDPAVNLTLRYAIDRARMDNMPKDAIERAVSKGGGPDADTLESVTYEGYGPGGVAIMVEALTDNRARTFGDVRSALEHNGGSLGASGSVAWNFELKAIFFVVAPEDKEEQVLEAAMEGGADDCSAADGGFDVTADPLQFGSVTEALLGHGFELEKNEIVPLPKSTVTLDDPEQVQVLVRILSALDDLDDVQSTATNLDWTDAAVEAAENA